MLIDLNQFIFLYQTMTQVSRRPLSPKVQERILNLFLNSFTLCSDKESASHFLEDLLTPTERMMLAKRLSIAFMLLQGYDYQTIKSTLKVSSPTVGKVSLWLKEKGEGYRRIINKIKKNERTKVIWDSIVDSIEDLFSTSPGRDWSGAKKKLWQHRRQRQKAF